MLSSSLRAPSVVLASIWLRGANRDRGSLPQLLHCLGFGFWLDVLKVLVLGGAEADATSFKRALRNLSRCGPRPFLQSQGAQSDWYRTCRAKTRTDPDDSRWIPMASNTWKTLNPKPKQKLY